MERDYDKEIENLKKEMDDLKTLFMQFMGSSNEKDMDNNEPLKKVRPMKNMHPDPKLSSIMNALCNITDKEDRTGSITYLGVFTSGGRQSNWIQNGINTDDLLALIENKSASTVLRVIGSICHYSLYIAIPLMQTYFQ